MAALLRWKRVGSKLTHPRRVCIDLYNRWGRLWRVPNKAGLRRAEPRETAILPKRRVRPRDLSVQ